MEWMKTEAIGRILAVGWRPNGNARVKRLLWRIYEKAMVAVMDHGALVSARPEHPQSG